MASRYCRSCEDFHDLDRPWPDACYGHFRKRSGSASTQIIRDIDPYQAVAGDVALGGKLPKIGGRRQHREFLKRNGYHNTEKDSSPKKPDYGPEVTEREVRQVYERLRDSK